MLPLLSLIDRLLSKIVFSNCCHSSAGFSQVFRFEPTTEELNTKLVHVKYCCASDKYTRVSKQNEVTEYWESCIYEQRNMFRKEEFDWHMV